MKRLMIISAALMVAMLYGAVDLIKAERSGEFAKLYKEDKPEKKSFMFDLANRIKPVKETEAEVKPVVTKTDESAARPKITLALYSRGSLKQDAYPLQLANNDESKIKIEKILY